MSDPNQPSPAKKKLRPPSLKAGGDENLSSVKKSPMKRFMSPTISRAAKVNPVPRTKIPAADRNESPAKLASPRASSFNLNNDGFRDENEKERSNNGDNNNLITDGSSPIPSSNYLSVSRSDGDESLSSVKKSPMKHFLSPTANQLSRTRVLAERNESPSIKFVPTPPPPRASSFKLNNGGFRDENDKEWNHNTNIDTLITDDLSPMIPYNPASNYLSPRPKFLRYNPERRSQILRRRVKLKEEDVLDLEQDTTDTESDISPGNAAAAAPLSPAKDDEMDDAIEEDEFEEEDEGSSVFGRVFQFLLLLMVLIASILYITSMNNLNPVEADYQEIQSCYPLVGFGRKIEVNGTCLLVGEGMMLRQQQHPVVAPSFLVDVEQKGDGEEEEAMEEVSEGGMVVVELQKAEAMEIQEEEENFIDITEDENNEAPYTEVLHPAAMEVLEEERLMEEENFIDITEDETNEAPYKDVLHPAAVEVLEEERLMEVEQKGEEEEEKEKEEAMEEVSEGGILLVVDEHQPSEVVEIQEKEESFIDLEEVTEDGIDGAKEEESFIDVEQVSEDVIDEVTTPQNGKSMVDFIVLLYAAILASAAGLLVLLMMTMRKRRNVASRDNADRRSKSTLVRPSPPRALRNSSTAEEKNNEAAEKKSEAAVVQEQAESSCSTMASGKKGTSSINNNKNELNAEEASRSDSPVGFRQAESHCSTTTSGEKGTTSSTSSIIKRKKKQEEIGDAGTTTPLRRSTRIAASRGILSP